MSLCRRAGSKASAGLPAGRSDYAKSAGQADDGILGFQVFNDVYTAQEEAGCLLAVPQKPD